MERNRRAVWKTWIFGDYNFGLEIWFPVPWMIMPVGSSRRKRFLEMVLVFGVSHTEMTYKTFTQESSESPPRTWKDLFYKYCCCCCARHNKANDCEAVTVRMRSRKRVSQTEETGQSSEQTKRRHGRYYKYWLRLCLASLFWMFYLMDRVLFFYRFS